MTADPNEIEPFILGKVVSGSFHPALWKTQQGALAVTLFLSRESALQYKSLLEDENWLVLQPQKSVLRDILALASQSQIHLAVLEPTQSTAKRIFSIPQLLESYDRTRVAPQ